jgi:tRNA dimethylallyltransferase
MNKVITIFGPTCSGKTNLSVLLAKHFSLDIISADSMQVYKSMDIGTAKITDKEKSGVTHYLIDEVYPNQHFSTNDFFNKACSIISKQHEKGKSIIVAGGTGLYFKSLFNGIFEEAAKDPAIREEIHAGYGENPQGTYLYLKSIDPEYASIIHQNDEKRIVRAIEIFRLTGKKQSELKNIKPEYDFLKIGIMPERKKLYEGINKRCDEMIGQGFLEEAKILLEKYPKNSNAFKAIGYSHAARLFNGEIDKTEFIRTFKRDTRRFAKRQFTLFKTFENVIWFENPNTEKTIKIAGDFLK